MSEVTIDTEAVQNLLDKERAELNAHASKVLAGISIYLNQWIADEDMYRKELVSMADRVGLAYAMHDATRFMKAGVKAEVAKLVYKTMGAVEEETPTVKFYRAKETLLALLLKKAQLLSGEMSDPMVGRYKVMHVHYLGEALDLFADLKP